MDYLVDTNCLLRLASKVDPHRHTVLNAFRKIHANKGKLFYTPQVLSETWNVLTRQSSSRGGFGLSIEEAERKIKLIEKHLVLLPDSLATFTEWRKLIVKYRVNGVQVHDAKLAASMMVHGIPLLLTFNTKDFSRFPMIGAIDPGTF